MNTASTPDRSSLVKYFDSLAPQRVRWVEKNRYYHQQLEKTFSFYIPPNRSVLEIGCGAGQLLAALKPARHGDRSQPEDDSGRKRAPSAS